MVLCYTGASRFSGATIERVMRAYERGDAGVARSLDGLRAVAERGGRRAARRGPRPPGSRCSARTGGTSRLSTPAMCTPDMARLEQAMRDAGALGRQGRGIGRGRLDVLPRTGRSRAARGGGPRGSTCALLPVRWATTGVHRADGRAAGGAPRRCSRSRPTSRRSATTIGRRAAPLLQRDAGDPVGRRRSSRWTAASARSTASRSTSIRGARTAHRCAALRPRATGASGTTAPGPAGSISGSPSERPTSRRSPRSTATKRRASGPASDPRRLCRALPRLPQPRQRPRPGPPVLLDLPRVGLAHRLPRRRLAPARERDCWPRPAPPKGEPRGRRGRRAHRRVRRGVLQPADLAQRRAGGDRGLVRGRGAGRPGAGRADRHHRPPGARVRRRRDVVRGRELPPLRAARPAPRDGLGGAGRRRPSPPIRGSPAASPRRSAGPGAHRAAGSHLSRPQGFPLRRLAGAADVSRALGGRARAAGRPDDRRCGLARGHCTSRRHPPAQRFDSYLHEAGSRTAGRAALRGPISPGGRCSRWLPALPAAARAVAARQRAAWKGRGSASSAPGDRYASLECGGYGGGHGHPDRLHLTLHADGVHWLPDPGTGSYVDPGSLLVPLDAGPQRAPARRRVPDARRCPLHRFGEPERWAWVAGRVRRARAARWSPGPDYLLDVVELRRRRGAPASSCRGIRPARSRSRAAGDWAPGELRDEFVEQPERFVPAAERADRRAGAPAEIAGCICTCCSMESCCARLGPGLPGAPEPTDFLVARAGGRAVRFVTVLETGDARPGPRGSRRAAS